MPNEAAASGRRENEVDEHRHLACAVSFKLNGETSSWCSNFVFGGDFLQVTEIRTIQSAGFTNRKYFNNPNTNNVAENSR